MPEKSKPEQQRPPQRQEDQPGHQTEMRPQPQSEAPYYKGSGKLEGRVALITGGDSGIGRAVAIYFAKEGADISVVYFDEHKDAKETQRQVEQEGRKCLLIAGDVQQESFCKQAVQQTVDELGKLDVLVNNAAVQYPQESIADITEEQLDKTFRTNIYSYFFMTKAALPHLKEGSSVLCTTSVTAYRGSAGLIDYSATKGAIVTFVRSLSQSLVKEGIRVNGVAPGPVWTPLIPASFAEDKVAKFGSDTPMGRAGQPEELAPAYVFLASQDSTYITGQVIHVNGGDFITS